MIAISFRFLAGRYHATPWRRHVNEGAVEWPPSPWRILRGLVATWKRTLPSLPQEQVEPILRALAEPPDFLLPSASTGHTRHYMPWFGGDRTLVFDAFVVVARERNQNGGGWHPAPLVVRWPNASLDSTQREMLARILANLNILGRSESWCEAKLVAGVENAAKLVCRPVAGDVSHDREIVRLLCPDPTSLLVTPEAVVTRTVGRGKKKPTVTVCDPAWNLCMETLQLHSERWSDPPGSRWIPYARPRDCFKVEPSVRVGRTRERPSIDVLRYVLDSTVLPLVTDTLPVAEAARRTLMGIHGRLAAKIGIQERSAVFSGKDAHGDPLSDHRHAYYLPTDEDGDGRLDHLTVYAGGGFGPHEQRAFDGLRKLRTGREGEERHPLCLLLLGMGTSVEYAPGPLQASKTWVSTTPYIATRYAKTRGQNRIDMASPEARAAFLKDDLGAQLTAVRPDIAMPDVTIEPIWDDNHAFKVAERWRTIQFKRFRRKPGDDGGRRLAGAFRISFPFPVRGPICLGHSSHFGMGLFLPDRARKSRD